MSLMTAPEVPDTGEPPLVDEATLAHRAKLKKRRRLMLWISLPFLLLAAATAAKLISLSAFTQWSISAYDSLDFPTAVERLEPLTSLNYVEPYKVHFNRGTAQLMDKKYESAEKSLTTAVDLAPDEVVCDVRRNLGYVYSQQGDIALREDNLLGALRFYDKAIRVLDVPECAQDQETQDQKEETEQKQDQTQEQQEQREQEQREQEQGGQGGQGGEGQGGEGGGDDQGGTGGEGQGGQGGEGQGQGGGEGQGEGGGGDGQQQGGGEGQGQGGGGAGGGSDGGSGGSKQDQLQDRNSQAQKERDQERQKSETGSGKRKTW